MDNLLEKLAALEHAQWSYWAKQILATENISEARSERWKISTNMKYEDLEEDEKDFDRMWAKKVLEIVNTTL